MSHINLERSPLYKRLKLRGREVLFHCSDAYTTKREAEAAANDARKHFDQPARVVRGKYGRYYLYVHGES